MALKDHRQPMAEENKNGLGTQPPASVEKKPEGNLENAGNAGELEALKKQLADREAVLAKQAEQLNQAGFNIERLKGKLKDNGIEENEDKMGRDQITEIVTTAVKPLADKIKEQETTIAELARANKSKEQISGDGSGGGQQPPNDQGMPEPNLSDVDKRLVSSFGGKWDPVKKGYVTKSGRFVPWSDKTGIAQEA